MILTFYEFFAGGGMVRAGLGEEWTCAFANDFDRKKGNTYLDNWGRGGELKVRDIRKVAATDLPGTADLAWASFPCQDLSLAGGGAGLRGERSGTFYPFWDVMHSLSEEGRSPRIIALENVVGTLTSHSGKDFTAICETYYKSGYRFGALVIDASLFVPQSRPRLFVIGVRDDVEIDANLTAPTPDSTFHTRNLQRAYGLLPKRVQRDWLWWKLPVPPKRNVGFGDYVEDNPACVDWHTADETAALLAKMTPINLAKVEKAKRAGQRVVGTIYKRTRMGPDGKAVRAEVRFDDVAGCLRTPAGGSSRQTIIVVDGDTVRSRLISTRETARLMGLPDEYHLPRGRNEAYHLTGDGVVVPVVRHLAAHLFEPLLCADDKVQQVAA
ncbi:DNA cytosine methyltransferase [Oricola indica]|uniref:DNA cytosine methyltransferase n=1 Tax=Oricola indica TaxID=2872591 RepID=UPI001CBF174A|nr:DNA (cytosine-5-)-methyltransferase [Oricola indica]